MAVVKGAKTKDMRAVQAAFARRYLDRTKGIYSVGIGREGGQLCIRVSGRDQALKGLPEVFQSTPVVTRVGGPGIVGLARR